MIKEAIPLLYTVMVLRRVIKDPVSKLVPLMIPLIYDTICGSYMNLNRITIIASNLRIFQLFSLAFRSHSQNLCLRSSPTIIFPQMYCFCIVNQHIGTLNTVLLSFYGWVYYWEEVDWVSSETIVM